MLCHVDPCCRLGLSFVDSWGPWFLGQEVEPDKLEGHTKQPVLSCGLHFEKSELRRPVARRESASKRGCCFPKPRCKDRMPSRNCEHGHRKDRCKECGGSQICEHDRQRSQCKECLGSSICPDMRIKSTCKECGGSQICEHDRPRRMCKECLESSICPHKRSSIDPRIVAAAPRIEATATDDRDAGAKEHFARSSSGFRLLMIGAIGVSYFTHGSIGSSVNQSCGLSHVKL
jgi:hypothetical protein